MKHRSNAILAARLRAFADQIEADERETTNIGVSLDIADPIESPPIERCVDPRGVRLFEARPTARLIS